MELKVFHVNNLDSNLNRRRYAQNDDTLYVAPEDERTDYVRSVLKLGTEHLSHLSSLQSQPPMANFYSGVLKCVSIGCKTSRLL